MPVPTFYIVLWVNSHPDSNDDVSIVFFSVSFFLPLF